MTRTMRDWGVILPPVIEVSRESWESTRRHVARLERENTLLKGRLRESKARELEAEAAFRLARETAARRAA